MKNNNFLRHQFEQAAQSQCYTYTQFVCSYSNNANFTNPSCWQSVTSCFTSQINTLIIFSIVCILVIVACNKDMLSKGNDTLSTQLNKSDYKVMLHYDAETVTTHKAANKADESKLKGYDKIQSMPIVDPICRRTSEFKSSA